jgi:hypothetical protein
VNRVNDTLNEILNQVRELKIVSAKKFVVALSHLHWSEMYLWQAFKTPENHLMYQSPDSEDWKLIKTVI